ncbi:Rho GDP-dissociation inhibitor 1 [Zea mays]|uniref:Rho GDP-dissociation inhibitor 1 n=1 Tax=Zea mays TaxID=4577 RepID=A0A1D6FQS0_MAIZE|nr:Rho GDP-dissociation inhibitor 1 [Zea mays]
MDDTEREKEKEKEKHDCGTDVEDEEEDEEGNKRVVVLGPQVPLKEQLELDKDDESLRRWKEQLLGQVDTEQLGDRTWSFPSRSRRTTRAMRLLSRTAAPTASASPSSSPTTSCPASSTPTLSGRLASKMLDQQSLYIMPRRSQFVDDDGKCFLEMSYYFEIRKEWPGGQ